jgi:hypothetical protein
MSFWLKCDSRSRAEDITDMRFRCFNALQTFCGATIKMAQFTKVVISYQQKDILAIRSISLCW